MVFPVIMYRCESWTIKKAEHWRIDGFKLWCWRRLSRITTLDSKEIRPVNPKINPENSLEGLMLKLKLQSFGHLMWRADSLEKILLLRKIECKRRKSRQGMRWLDGIIDLLDITLSELQEIVKDREAGCAVVRGVTKSQTLSDWTTISRRNLNSSPWISIGVFYIKSLVTQSCPTLCDHMDCRLPGSSIHGIFQARVLEWVAISFSRGSSWPRDWTRVSCTVGRRFTVWATREVIAKAPNTYFLLSQVVLKPEGKIPCSMVESPVIMKGKHPDLLGDASVCKQVDT